MKILIYGAGVIGCTYGWQLANIGCDISILVKENRKKTIVENGINIHCTDYRNGKECAHDVIFRPKVIDSLTADNDFDYIIVSTNSLNLDDILTVLKQSASKAHILFFQNMWIDDIEKIKEQLAPTQYFFGFPFMAGGGRREDGGITSIISGSKYSKTMLGEASGEITPRGLKLVEILSQANMKAFISDQIITWLVPHCAFMAAISSSILVSGGTMKEFLANTKMVKMAIRGIREGFSICEKIGINPKQEKVNKLYYLPLFISSSIVKMVCRNKAMQSMFDLYLKNATAEVLKMLDDIIKSGESNKVSTTNLPNLYKRIKE